MLWFLKLLNNAKNTAKEIIDAYPAENNFYLITNDFLSQHTSSYTNKSNLYESYLTT